MMVLSRVIALFVYILPFLLFPLHLYDMENHREHSAYEDYRREGCSSVSCACDAYSHSECLLCGFIRAHTSILALEPPEQLLPLAFVGNCEDIIFLPVIDCSFNPTARSPPPALG